MTVTRSTLNHGSGKDMLAIFRRGRCTIREVTPAAQFAASQHGVPAWLLLANHVVVSRFGRERVTLNFGQSHPWSNGIFFDHPQLAVSLHSDQQIALLIYFNIYARALAEQWGDIFKKNLSPSKLLPVLCDAGFQNREHIASMLAVTEAYGLRESEKGRAS